MDQYQWLKHYFSMLKFAAFKTLICFGTKSPRLFKFWTRNSKAMLLILLTDFDSEQWNIKCQSYSIQYELDKFIRGALLLYWISIGCPAQKDTIIMCLIHQQIFRKKGTTSAGGKKSPHILIIFGKFYIQEMDLKKCWCISAWSFNQSTNEAWTYLIKHNKSFEFLRNSAGLI